MNESDDFSFIQRRNQSAFEGDDRLMRALNSFKMRYYQAFQSDEIGEFFEGLQKYVKIKEKTIMNKILVLNGRCLNVQKRLDLYRSEYQN